MIPIPVLLAPLGVQALAMGFDELHFHRKRGLGSWERIGHPLDTLTMLACLGWALGTAANARNLFVYVTLAAGSCLFITKDEFIHARRCSPGEHWVHALLFVVHPLTLLSVGLLWFSLHPLANAWPGLRVDAAFAEHALGAQFAATAGFCLYQACYWNIPWIRPAPFVR